MYMLYKELSQKELNLLIYKIILIMGNIFDRNKENE